MTPVYAFVKQGYESSLVRRAATERINAGESAPDFALKDLQGMDFTLSSLRGKYVVLDFWGSWCSWCIKGIPDMKKASDLLYLFGCNVEITPRLILTECFCSYCQGKIQKESGRINEPLSSFYTAVKNDAV